MAILIKCDNCGDLMKQREMSQIDINLPEGVSVGPGDSTQFRMTSYGPQEAGQVDHYHFCPECITVLLIALKSRKQQIMRGIKPGMEAN